MYEKERSRARDFLHIDAVLTTCRVPFNNIFSGST